MIAAKDTRVIRRAKEAINRIDPVDVKTSYRLEQGFTFELNLAGIATSTATSSSQQESRAATADASHHQEFGTPCVTRECRSTTWSASCAAE